VQRLGDNTITGGQADGRLDTNDSITLGGVNDTAVGLGTKSNGDQVGTNSNTGTGAATTGVNGEVVGTAALATTGTEALGVVVRAHISPLTQGTLAQEQSTGLTHAVNNVGITGDNATEQSPATSSGLHTIFGGDVVLDNERDTVQRATDIALGTLIIQLLGNSERIRVVLQDGTGR
jgi:hypothetical protein